MMDGYICVPRDIFAQGYFGKEESFSKREAFIDLVRMAAFKDAVVTIAGNKYQVGRGQLATSKHILAKRWGWSIDKVRRFIALLIADGLCVLVRSNQATVLAITDFDKYQGDVPAPAPREVKPRKKPQKAEGLNFPYASEGFMKVWNTLISQPKWKGKTTNALQMSLDKLGKYEEAYAIELMNRAIERNWQGVVFDTTDADYEKWKATRPQPPKPKEPEPTNNSVFNDPLMREFIAERQRANQ